MDADDVRRATWRMAHEIIERNHGIDDVVVIGLQTGGVRIAEPAGRGHRCGDGVIIPVGTLDVAFYRDDIGLRPVLPEATTEIPVDLTGETVVLVDDVLFTGPNRAGRPQRPGRLRAGPGGPAGRHGRPGPPGAARSGPTTWARTCPPGATRWST